MENEKIVPAEGREMNFWDLCVAIARAIGRGCKALGRILGRMIRLTYRYWYIVLLFVIVAIGCAYYYTRAENLTYRVNAIAMLNGPSIQQFEQAYAPLQSGKMLSEEDAITPYIKSRIAERFTTYRVVDCLDDGVADYIDFKCKSQPTDTVKVQMQDRICLQFCIKARDLDQLPAIEEAILAKLNANEAVQKSYATYRENILEQVDFNHRQVQKLDSLTSSYYFNYQLNTQANAVPQTNGVVFYGDRKIYLFLQKIYDHQLHTQAGDYRAQLVTAPIVLENHFAADPMPVNGRAKYMILFLLLGWILGCVIAQIIDRRKDLAQWLKQA